MAFSFAFPFLPVFPREKKNAIFIAVLGDKRRAAEWEENSIFPDRISAVSRGKLATHTGTLNALRSRRILGKRSRSPFPIRVAPGGVHVAPPSSESIACIKCDWYNFGIALESKCVIRVCVCGRKEKKSIIRFNSFRISGQMNAISKCHAYFTYTYIPI